MLISLLLAAAPVERAATPREQAAVKDYFDGVLFDGRSARWRFETVRADFVICGYVNAKNRLGAFTGWQPFYWTFHDKDGRIVAPGDSVIVLNAICPNLQTSG